MAIATWNVRTMMTRMSTDKDLDPENTTIRKTATIDSELFCRGVDIAALQETCLAGTGIIKEANYTFFWFGRPSEESRIYGTGFAISNQLLCSSQTPSGVNDRISVLKVNTKQGTIFAVDASAPTLAASSDDKDCFYHTLEDTIRKASISERVILLGDINARIGEDHSSWPECLGHFGVGNINENGQRLLQLCCRNNLVVTNTLFPGKPHRKLSGCYPRLKKWHQLDFVITRSKHKVEFLNR
ncbi:craniofacial development protein 2-like [Watersipora subatra]|uniref:craniofacial development protein 2-like n=1 Tax=Watersipora subatra TaxID=2589382 RepID=UPI00355B569E